MANPNELRIGNEVNTYWHMNDCPNPAKFLAPVTIAAIGKDSIITNHHQSIVFFKDGKENILGIQLTKEWLIKFGFTPDKHNLVYDHPLPATPENEHKDLGTSYPSFFYNKRLNRWMDCHTRVCIDYVHQLQNLYFALTGEELTIK